MILHYHDFMKWRGWAVADFGCAWYRTLQYHLPFHILMEIWLMKLLIRW